MMPTARRCRFLRQMPAACAAAGLSWCASTDPSWQTPSRSWELAQRFSSHPPLSLCASAVLTAKGAALAHLSGQTARQTAARWRRRRPSSSLPPCPAPALQTAQAPTAHRCGRGIAGRGCEQVAAACSVQCPAPAQPTLKFRRSQLPCGEQLQLVACPCVTPTSTVWPTRLLNTATRKAHPCCGRCLRTATTISGWCAEPAGGCSSTLAAATWLGTSSWRQQRGGNSRRK